MTLQNQKGKATVPAAQNDNYYILDKQLTPLNKGEMKPLQKII